MTGITHHSCGATEINRRRVPCGDLEWYRWTMACEHKRASKPTVTTSIVPTSRRARASTHHSCKSKRIAAAATTAQDQVRSLDLSCVEPCASEMCYTARPGSRNGEDRALKTEDNGVVNKRSGRTLYAGAVVGWVAPRNAPTPLRNRPIMTSQRNVPNAAEQCATPFSHGFTWLGPRAP